MSRPFASMPHMPRADGPNMILVLFALALVIGLLVGLGARSWMRAADERLGVPDETRLSAEAVELGYRSETDFISDRKRAAVALRQVLAAPPGTQRLWENAESGNRGVIWGADETMREGGDVCRHLERRTLVNRAFRSAQAMACRNAAGVWNDAVYWRGG